MAAGTAAPPQPDDSMPSRAPAAREFLFIRSFLNRLQPVVSPAGFYAVARQGLPDAHADLLIQVIHIRLVARRGGPQPSAHPICPSLLNEFQGPINLPLREEQR